MMRYDSGGSGRFPIVAPTGGVTIGEPITIGDLVVVPVSTAAGGETVTVERAGVLRYTGAKKKSGEAWALGDTLYPSAAGEWTTTAGGLKAGGYAGAAAASSATVGVVLVGA